MTQALSRRILLSLAVVTFLLASSALAFWIYFRSPRLGGDFTLTNAAGPWTFSDHSRDVNLIYFGYVKCPDVCPMTLSRVATAMRSLSPSDANRVQVVFISVDSAHDTPESVASYAAQFNPSFVGLTGTPEAIRRAADLYQANYLIESDPKSHLGYNIMHTMRVFIADKKGRLRDAIPDPNSVDAVLSAVRKNL